MKKLLRLTKEGHFQFILSFTLLIFVFLYKAFDLPSPIQLIELAEYYYNEYGSFVIIIGAFLEGLFLLSIYFPGSLVILTAVLISNKNIESLFLIGSLSLIGFGLAYIINYFLGSKGIYRSLMYLGKDDWITKMEKRLIKNEKKTLFISAMHPNILSIAIVCMGIARRPIFYVIGLSILFNAIWITIWMIIGLPLLNSINYSSNNLFPAIIGLIFLWGVLNIARDRFNRH